MNKLKLFLYANIAFVGSLMASDWVVEAPKWTRAILAAYLAGCTAVKALDSMARGNGNGKTPPVTMPVAPEPPKP